MKLFDLGQALKLARIRQSLTQHELAIRTGISLSTISGLERGTLLEIGVVKLLQLFSAVGLELRTSSVGQRRTLDDVYAENVQKAYTGQIEQSTLNARLIPNQATKLIKTRTKEKPTLNDSGQRQRVRHRKGKK